MWLNSPETLYLEHINGILLRKPTLLKFNLGWSDITVKGLEVQTHRNLIMLTVNHTITQFNWTEFDAGLVQSPCGGEIFIVYGISANNSLGTRHATCHPQTGWMISFVCR